MKSLNRKIISTAVILSFVVHLFAVHPLESSMVICKTEDGIAIEKLSTQGICEHPETQSQDYVLTINPNDCDDTSLFDEHHNYDLIKIRNNFHLLFSCSTTILTKNSFYTGTKNNFIHKNNFTRLSHKLLSTELLLI